MNADDAMTRNVTGRVSECRAYVTEIRSRLGGGRHAGRSASERRESHDTRWIVRTIAS